MVAPLLGLHAAYPRCNPQYSKNAAHFVVVLVNRQEPQCLRYNSAEEDEKEKSLNAG